MRERSRIIHDKAMRNKLHHFDVDMNRFPDVVRFVCGIIKVSGSVQRSSSAAVQLQFQYQFIGCSSSHCK